MTPFVRDIPRGRVIGLLGRHGASKTQDLTQSLAKIPTNDAWIAVLALENDASLWTLDKHFDLVEDLDVRRW